MSIAFIPDKSELIYDWFCDRIAQVFHIFYVSESLLSKAGGISLSWEPAVVTDILHTFASQDLWDEP